jgi:hypothetical protein
MKSRRSLRSWPRQRAWSWPHVEAGRNGDAMSAAAAAKVRGPGSTAATTPSSEFPGQVYVYDSRAAVMTILHPRIGQRMGVRRGFQGDDGRIHLG